MAPSAVKNSKRISGQKSVSPVKIGDAGKEHMMVCIRTLFALHYVETSNQCELKRS